MILEKEIQVGDSRLNAQPKNITGEYKEINGELWFKIANHDEMPPFFMSIVSHSDHWMFISSNGALSAGRKNAESTLFPYYTDDVIHDSAEKTGSKTICFVSRSADEKLWEPFSERYEGIYDVERNIYKHYTGNAVMFEETNHDLQLTFRYSWQFSEQFGFVKKSMLVNDGNGECEVRMLDGMQNVLPYGVDSKLQTNLSTLTDAYKKNELDVETGLGMFMLSAIITDKAEPSESLKTTTVWHCGGTNPTYLLSAEQLRNFRKGQDLVQEHDVRATRGAYFINQHFTLFPDQDIEWYLIAEINQDASDVASLRKFIGQDSQVISDLLEQDIQKGRKRLLEMIAMADGLQLTSDLLTSSRHLANVLFNNMRGGVFEEQYDVEVEDFSNFLKQSNIRTYESSKSLIGLLPKFTTYDELLEVGKASKQSDLLRLIYEYLPLSFSRRHGDPSRPWNYFSIDIHDQLGGRNRNYEGNWRDIFQNWEALGMSFPTYLESMIAKFVNASTVDGYNPYRITRSGIDWETIEPDNPWSFIGYWGDHQIIYLLKLLELSHQYHPGRIEGMLNEKMFSYANVPYRIKGYQNIVSNPQDTIYFDEDIEGVANFKTNKIGSDGKLVWDTNDEVVKVTLIEKLLVASLTKISNFIPEAGIWLNTQRPEWNDANNALVGNGTSMVTLCYLRRFMSRLKALLTDTQTYSISEEVSEFFYGLQAALQFHKPALNHTEFGDRNRKNLVDALGGVGETYRKRVYQGLNGNQSQILGRTILEFCDLCIEYIDQSIGANKREDNLFHAYNLISFEDDTITVDHLYEMLEGQVAVLSSGYLSPEEVVSVLDALKQSNIYREEHYSYMLYPNRELPRFLEKNNIPRSYADQSVLLNKLAETGNKLLVKKDINGVFHFNGSFNNANDVKAALDKIRSDHEMKELVDRESNQLLKLFEDMFHHHAFTGRSGTFYGYEGLGSIYWHMVSKLVLAIAENYHWAFAKNTNQAVISRMMDYYYETRAGIGLNKTPELYGAFPTDPYSHTPGNAGAQQPGMTGQVKEDIISRWYELGVFVEDGNMVFAPNMLRPEEFVTKSCTFEYFDVNDEWRTIEISPNSLAFTYCQVPIIYHISNRTQVTIEYNKGETVVFDGNVLTREIAGHIFDRAKKIVKVTCEFSTR